MLVRVMLKWNVVGELFVFVEVIVDECDEIIYGVVFVGVVDFQGDGGVDVSC